jgi:predicted RNA-binding protein
MCEAAVYLLKDGDEELILENIDLLKSEGDQIELINIFGEERKIRARIRSLSLIDHKIVLEPLAPKHR